MTKRPKVPYAKGRRFCIFCGAPANSAEHIMPKWAHPILPRAEKYHQVAARVTRSTGAANMMRNYTRQGAVYTTRVPVVCRGCNSDWMSTFEESVRPFFAPMVTGRRVFLNRADRDTLAQYLTYKLLVLDWLADDPILPPDWAHEFYRSRQIPAHAQICLFHCLEWDNIDTLGAGFLHADDPRPVEPNTKSFTVGFGELLVFAVLSTEVDFDTHFDPAVAVQLWPFEPMLMFWPPPTIIDEGQARFVATTLERIESSPDVINDGD